MEDNKKNNKVLIVVIAVLVIIILVLSLVIFFIVNNKDKPNENNVNNVNTVNENNNVNNQNVVTNEIKSNQGIDIDIGVPDPNAIRDPDKFRGRPHSYWSELVKGYISSHYEYIPKEVRCDYAQTGNYVATVMTQYEVSTEFILDPKTGEAEDVLTGEIVDFEENELKERYSNIPFGMDDYISIGYILDELVDPYAANFFYNTTVNFDDFEKIDLRINDKDTGNRFYIVPKNHNVKVSIYMINNDGVKDVLLRDEIDKPFVLFTDYVEYVPKYGIEYEYTDYAGNKKKGYFEISFNGYDGKLNLPNDNKDCRVYDSSLYAN